MPLLGFFHPATSFSALMWHVFLNFLFMLQPAPIDGNSPSSPCLLALGVPHVQPSHLAAELVGRQQAPVARGLCWKCPSADATSSAWSWWHWQWGSLLCCFVFTSTFLRIKLNILPLGSPCSSLEWATPTSVLKSESVQNFHFHPQHSSVLKAFSEARLLKLDSFLSNVI